MEVCMYVCVCVVVVVCVREREKESKILENTNSQNTSFSVDDISEQHDDCIESPNVSSVIDFLKFHM